MLSGYLSKKQAIGKFWKGELALFTSFLVFELINVALSYFFKQTLIPIVQPYWTLWYLLSLIYWRIILQFLPSNWMDHRCMIIVGAFALALATPLLPFGYIASFQRTFTFLPFFMIGYYIRQGNYLLVLRSMGVWKPAIIMGLCILVCCLFVHMGLPVMQTLRGADTYMNCYLPTLYAMLLKCILLVASLCFCLALFSVFKVTNVRFANEGRNSLSYYLYHALIIEFVLLPLSELCKINHSVILVIVSTVLNLIACYIISRIQIFKYLTSPSVVIKLKQNRYDYWLHNRCF